MALTCKNCGGNISIDVNSNNIICDSCGAQQTLFNALADDADSSIYKEDSVSNGALNIYKRALSMMSSARTEKSFIFAAGVFDEIPGVLNANFLAKECREKAELFKSEQIYCCAVLNMKSDEPNKIEDAIKSFKSLGDYKDSVKKTEECLSLLSVAQVNYQEKLKKAEQQRIEEEKQKQKNATKRKIVGGIISLIILALIMVGIIGYFNIYSSSNIKISLLPDEENFVV